jgi:hypothetical protein
MKDLGTDERILKWILKKRSVITWTGLIWPRMEPLVGSWEDGN